MEIVNKRLEEIKPYEKNPRKNDKAVPYVVESIKQFGFKVPIVIDRDGVIVAGHTRYKAAKFLKMDVVPCIIADDLSDEQVKAFRLADNKVGEVATWKDDVLSFELADIIDIDMTNFGFELSDKELEEDTFEEGEVEFSKELLLSHNYIVLYFDNDFDWMVAQEKFGLKEVKDLIPRKGQPTGIGRVIEGKEVLKWLN